MPDHHGDHQIVFVHRKGRDQTLGAGYAGLLQHQIVGGITDDVGQVFEFFFRFAQALHALLVGLDHHVRRARLLQFFDRVPAGIAQSAHHVVLLEFADSLLHLAPPENVGDLAFHQESGNGGQHICGNRPAKNNDADVENTQAGMIGGAENFLAGAVAHHRHRHHVQRLQEADVVADQHVSHGAERRECQHHEQSVDQAMAQVHGRRMLRGENWPNLSMKSVASSQ